MGYYFFKISKNGALFEVGYYSKMGYYSSKYGMYINNVKVGRAREDGEGKGKRGEPTPEY